MFTPTHIYARAEHVRVLCSVQSPCAYSPPLFTITCYLLSDKNK